MALINRVRVTWTGPAVVGGGVSTFYFTGAAAGIHSLVDNLFEGMQSLFPSSVTINIPGVGDVLDSDTGEIVTGWSDGAASTWVGSASNNNYAAGVGARIIWTTNGRTNNRRVRGTTFLVPISVANYDTDGTLTSTAYNVINDNADALVTAADNSLVVWTRPNSEHGGAINSVLSAAPADKSSWLRTRKY